MSLLFRTVSRPPSWLAQEIHLSPCFPPSMGSPAPGTPISGRCAAHAIPPQLPFPHRTGLPFVTGERGGDEKPGGDMPRLEGAQRQGRGQLGKAHTQRAVLSSHLRGGRALTGGMTPLTGARPWHAVARRFK